MSVKKKLGSFGLTLSAITSVLAFMLFANTAFAQGGLNMTEGVTPISREVYQLHMTILYIVTAIGIAVFGVMFWSIFKHRKSKGAVPAQFHHSTVAEITWTIIPILILVVVAVPATRVLVAMEDTGDTDITIKITGHQWKWQYEYIEEGFKFMSNLDTDSNDIRQRASGQDPFSHENYLIDVDNPVVVPVNTRIRLLTTAADVIHAWWVPDLGWKRDAIPGFINDNWTYIEEEGTYRGQCAELCGKDHGFMPIVVKAVSKEQYALWVDEQKSLADAAADAAGKAFASLDDAIAKGNEVYTANCAACHQANGQGIPGAVPAIAGSAIVNGGDIAEHLDIVINGKNGIMPSFGPQLNDGEIAAVISFQRNAFGNVTGDLVQPADVASAR